MAQQHVLLFLGGMHHDFEGFAGAAAGILAPAAYEVEPVYGLDRLASLSTETCDLVISYTSLSKHRPGQNDTGPERLTDEQIAGLAAWVRQGGRLLAVHCATVAGESGPELARLLGGRFLSHPPRFAFTVYPVFGEHPITAGMAAFTVFDEFYVQEFDPSVHIHMAAVDRGVAYPMVWSKAEGKGRVAYVAMGHNEAVWQLAPYGQLLRQAAAWLSE